MGPIPKTNTFKMPSQREQLTDMTNTQMSVHMKRYQEQKHLSHLVQAGQTKASCLR